jgi:hypothetical protein
MESKGLYEEKIDNGDNASVIENPDDQDDYRYSTVSIFELERQLLDNPNRRFIAYFTFFAIFEYFLFYILQRYFIQHKIFVSETEDQSRKESLDFEISKFLLFRILMIFSIALSKRKGVSHIKLIVNEFKVNKSFKYFVFVDFLLNLCIISLIQNYMVVSVLLAVKSKPVVFAVTRFLKGFHIRHNEMVIFVTALVFIFCVYFWRLSKHFLSIFVMIFGACLFFFNEESRTENINLHEFEILEYLSKFALLVLFMLKAIISLNPSVFCFEWKDIIIGMVIVGIEGLRIYVIKRIHKFKRDNSVRTYQPGMIVFVGAVALILDLILMTNNFKVAEFLGSLVFVLGLYYNERFQIVRLFSSHPDSNPTSDELLIPK